MIGHEVMSKGLEIYFSRHKWTNTTLPDFIGALDEAYRASPNPELGPSFNFASWADTWLKSSGANRVAAEAAYKEDGTLESLKIK